MDRREEAISSPAHERSPRLDGYEHFPDQGPRNFLQRSVELPLFVRGLRLPAGGAVLEVGCGRGVALPVLHTMLAPRVLVGLDIEGAFLDVAAGRPGFGGTFRLVHGDLRALPFRRATFDLVIDFGTCYHVTDGARAVREIGRVLRSGGVFATESKVSQLLAHPVRTRGRRLRVDPALLRPARHAGLWRSWVRVG